ncbi:glycosyltransferase family 4 protein [Flavobacterium alkalisoli]|uniref:Glycosyltransferase family 4 protein n=1 Tax=Flavobacterium alkalisoli TaxID=2602769 RepID=A0A5B9FW60_9FLAO|nr:glycosyltransferase family 4 protein [Flavobacterium alkalisoli]QEE51290.1 glycosyltransferase family 4 protein [Flavobacterium alkalisoli]
MRLLYITTKVSGAGGMQKVLAVKTDYLIEHSDYKIDILISNAEPGEEVIHEFNPSINFHQISPAKGLAYFKSYSKLLKNKIKDINPDIIIMCDNGLKSFLLPFIMKKDYPLIYELHVAKRILSKGDGLFKFVRDKIIFSFISFCSSAFDRFVVLTPSEKEEWNLKNIVVIPNPLWFTNESLSRLENKTVVAVGRHVYEKGYDRMFEIWKKVLDKHPDWQLHIYGDKNIDINLEELANSIGINENVKFFDATKNILKAYHEASLYLMTSRYEGFGMVLIEAMGVGVPCIAYNCPTGPSGIIINGYNGYLIDDGDEKAFANAVLQLIEHEEMREEMGKNAYNSSQRFFLPEIMQKWNDLFTSLLK